MATSVRQTKGSQCGSDWNTHALNEEVSPSGVLLCPPYQQDKPAPAMKNVRNVTDLNEILGERMIMHSEMERKAHVMPGFV
jgi:hypothetical protein